MPAWRRGDQVRHISRDMCGASRGTALVTFADLEGESCTAVQWRGGSLTVCRTKFLDIAQPQNTKGDS